MTAQPLKILEQVSGWEDATTEVLDGGLTNRTWLATSADGRKAVLKIDDEPREIPLNSRCDEAYVQNSAASVGLAGKVILADCGFYLCEFVDGIAWDRSCMYEPGNLELVGAALRRLHKLPLTGRSFDAVIAARRYVEGGTRLDDATVEKCTSLIARMRLPQNLCCCHNDLVAENIVTSPTLKFIDWEYACDNDPFFDLATIVEHHQLDDASVTRLLDSYMEGNGSRWRAHLEKQRLLYLALLCLWLASRRDTDDAELAVVKDRLVTSYYEAL